MNSLSKNCPACQTANPVSALLCACGADLSGVVPRRASSPRAPAEQPAPESLACRDCGEPNPSYLILCRTCGTELAAEPEKIPALVVDFSGTRETCRQEEILGREGTLGVDFFQEHPGVSRKHVRLFREGSAWFIEVLSASTNPTYFEDKKLEKGKSIRLPHGGTLRLSKTCSVELVLEED